MLAARLYGKENLRVENIADPEIGPGELLLKVKAATVCGTDIRMYKNGFTGISAQSPLIPGHELSGVIERTGGQISHYREGMRVAVAPNLGCGICDLCVSGNTQLCPDSRALGINIDGGFAEYLRIPEGAVRQGNVVELMPEISFAEAAMAEPLSCVFNAFERCHVQAGQVVLIIGSGPIGLMHAKLAKMAGAARVIMNDLREERLDLSLKLEDGLLAVAGSETLKESVLEMTDGRGVDVCIVACPSPRAQRYSLELAAVNGTVCFFGGLPVTVSEVPLNTNLIHYRQLTVTGTTRSSLRQYRKTLKLMGEGLIRIGNLISVRYPLLEVNKAFQSAIQGIGLKNAVELPD